MAELSKREFMVVSLVAEGFTNKEIGERLHMAENTVNRTLIRLYQRLQVRDRASAVAWAFRNGYLRAGNSAPALRPQRELKPCGTPGARARHIYYGEKVCDVCREGERWRDRERRQRKRETRKRVAA